MCGIVCITGDKSGFVHKVREKAMNSLNSRFEGTQSGPEAMVQCVNDSYDGAASIVAYVRKKLNVTSFPHIAIFGSSVSGLCDLAVSGVYLRLFFCTNWSL